MRVLVRRTGLNTLATLVNLVLTAAVGVVLIGNEMVAPRPSGGWIALGVLFLVWAAVILSVLLRPVVVKLDAHGVAVRRLFGRHRFAWDELRWLDFDSSARVGLIAGTVEGRERVAAFAKRAIRPEALAPALAAIAARRPDLPTRAPLKEVA